jgi:hypothetical protein
VVEGRDGFLRGRVLADKNDIVRTTLKEGLDSK